MKLLLLSFLIGVLLSCNSGPRFKVTEKIYDWENMPIDPGYRVVFDVIDTNNPDEKDGEKIVWQNELLASKATDSAKKSELAIAQKIADQLNSVK